MLYEKAAALFEEERETMATTRVVQADFNLHFQVQSCEEVGELNGRKVHRIKVDFGDGKTYTLCSKGKLKCVFEMLEYIGREAEKMTPKQFEHFKKAHKGKIIRLGYKMHGDDQHTRLFKTDRHSRVFENVFRKTSKFTKYTEADLKEIKRYAKLWEGMRIAGDDEGSPAARLRRKGVSGLGFRVTDPSQEDRRVARAAQLGLRVAAAGGSVRGAHLVAGGQSSATRDAAKV